MNNTEIPDGPDQLDTPTQLEFFRETSVRSANENGDPTILAFLKSPHVDHTIEQPITPRLFPRDKNGGGYLFELCPQVGCPVGCDFCECGSLRGNLSPQEVVEQIKILQTEAASRGIAIPGPYKIEFTDGGELLLNPQCIDILLAVMQYMPVKIKVSSVLPNLPVLRTNIHEMLKLVETYEPGLNLQASLSSTNPGKRQERMRGKVSLLPFTDIRRLGEEFIQRHPENRKITLTFTLTEDSHCVPEEIVGILPPELFVIRLHPFKPHRKSEMPRMISVGKSTELARRFTDIGYRVIHEILDPVEARQLFV